MNCPLCHKREVSERAARECERKGYRMVCSFCLAETFRAQRPRVWPQIVPALAVRFYSIEEAEERREAA